MLHFTVNSTTARVGKNKGQTVYYAQRDTPSRLSSKAVEDLLVEKTSLSRGDVRHAITSLAETIRWAIENGMVVDLADLGTFKVDAVGRQKLSIEEVNATTIGRVGIRFYPKLEMRKALRSVPISVYNPKDKSESTTKPVVPSTPGVPPSTGGSQPGGSNDDLLSGF